MKINKDSTGFIFVISVVLCLFCATLVSIAAVGLKGAQDKNAAIELKVTILQAAGIYDAKKNIDDLYKHIEAKVIDLKTGEFLNNVNADSFNAKKAAKDPKQSRALTQDEDPASIHRITNDSIVYLQKNDKNQVEKIILPIHGYGLWGTMYGFLAMSNDGKIIKGLTFYNHKETPGLGGEITNPTWQALWVNKQGYDKNGKPDIRLVKGGASNNPELAKHQVDSLAGATLTSRGVERTINFWLGATGYEPFLTKFAKSATTTK